MTTPQRPKPHSKVRTWSLATLNRNSDYVLFWHTGTKSWEVVLIDKRTTVVTRAHVEKGRRIRTSDATEGAQRRGLSGSGTPAPLTEDA